MNDKDETRAWWESSSAPLIEGGQGRSGDDLAGCAFQAMCLVLAIAIATAVAITIKAAL
jgi:hypothetical protein